MVASGITLASLRRTNAICKTLIALSRSRVAALPWGIEVKARRASRVQIDPGLKVVGDEAWSA
jgi:hypothetical protein